MKIKFISLLVSILYLPALLIGQFIGNIVGTLIISILGNFWFSFIINLISEIAHMLIGGIIAGLFCGYVITKVYKNYNFVYVSVIPWLVTIFYLSGIFIIAPYYGVDIDLVSFGDAGACILTIVTFHIYLKNNQYYKNL